MGVLFMFTGFLFTDIEEEEEIQVDCNREREGEKNMLHKGLHREIKKKEQELV